MKRLLSLTVLTLVLHFAHAQQNERILGRASQNLKDPSEAAMNLYNKGIEYADKKDYPKSIRCYEQAIALDSDYIDAYNNLGLAFYEAGPLDSAAFYLKISLRLLPTGTTALTNLGLTYEKGNDLAKALECYKKLTTLKPQDPEGYYNCARALLTMGSLQDGLTQALQAEKLYTKQNSPSLPDCHYVIFVAYYNLQNKPLAKKYMALCKKEGVQIPADMEAALK